MKYLLNFFILTKILLTVKNGYTEFYWQFLRNFDDFILLKPPPPKIYQPKNKNFTLVFVCLTSNNGLVFLALLVLLHYSFNILHVQISTAVIVPLLKERVHHVLPLGRQRLLSSLFTKSRITDQS